ncbi:hypothetical protein [Nocardia sputi]|uniref:hypothetical protein n=1 Tax=Nocardia sputi TaxID=2943705 RepID=UPI00135BD759|nr:hypothetical protein [Nocardia sputi]UAK31028.1 hypothetical protein K8O92_24680 [Nocardia asteroides]
MTMSWSVSSRLSRPASWARAIRAHHDLSPAKPLEARRAQAYIGFLKGRNDGTSRRRLERHHAEAL